MSHEYNVSAFNSERDIKIISTSYKKEKWREKYKNKSNGNFGYRCISL